jgi:hypothetical protein
MSINYLPEGNFTDYLNEDSGIDLSREDSSARGQSYSSNLFTPSSEPVAKKRKQSSDLSSELELCLREIDESPDPQKARKGIHQALKLIETYPSLKRDLIGQLEKIKPESLKLFTEELYQKIVDFPLQLQALSNSNQVMGWMNSFLSREKFEALVEKLCLSGMQQAFEKALCFTWAQPGGKRRILELINFSEMQLSGGFFEMFNITEKFDLTEIIEILSSGDKVNPSLVKELIVDLVQKNKINKKEAIEILNALVEKGFAQPVSWAIDLIRSEVDLAKRSIPGAFSSFCDQLSYVKEYVRWCAFDYKNIHFEGASKDFIEQICSKKNLSTLSSCLNEQTLSMAGTARLEKEEGGGIVFSDALRKEIPVSLFNFPEFLDFYTQADLQSALSYFDHDVIPTRKGEPQLLVDGELTLWSGILDRFFLNKRVEGGRVVTEIVEKETGVVFYYLHNGLTAHNMTDVLNPIKFEEPDGKFRVTFLALDHGDSSSPEGVKRLINTHAWIQLKDGNGALFSAGKWGSGRVVSPDHHQYHTRLPKLTASCEVSEQKFNEILAHITRLQGAEEKRFNLLTDNCSCFASHIACVAVEAEVKSKANLKKLDSFENRIKYYNAALMISKELFKNKDKIKKMHAEMIEMQDKSAKKALAILISRTAKEFGIREPVFLTENMMRLLLDKDKFYMDIFSDIIEILDSDDEKKMINCLFNLIYETSIAIEKMDLHHPYSLWEALSKNKKITSARGVKKI